MDFAKKYFLASQWDTKSENHCKVNLMQKLNITIHIIPY